MLSTFIGSEIYEGSRYAPDHIAQCKESQFHNVIKEDTSGRFFILINNRITSCTTTCCSFWYIDPEILEKHPSFADLFDRFINGSDEFRNSRFKCYPRIIAGSWLLTKMVPNVPTLLGTKVPITYHRGRNYLELGIQCDANLLARSILKIAYPISKSLVVDQCYILQSETVKELPELIFAGVQYQYIDLTKGIKITQRISE